MNDSHSTNPPADPDILPPELLLAAIVESSDDGIISKNLEGTITSWNPAAERIFGHTAAEAVGKNITIIIPLERREEEPVILEKLKRGERVHHFDTRRMRKDGTFVDVSLTISPIRNAAGVIVGASKIVRDVTARKKAQEALLKQKDKLEIVSEIGTSLAAERNLEKLVQAVTDAGRELSGAAFGAFFYTIKNALGEAFMLYTLSGAPREAFERFGTPRNTPIFAPTFAGEGVVRIADVLADPRYGQMPPHHGMPRGHLPVRSYLALPVISRSGDVIGGLFFGHPDPGVFSEESEQLLTTIAGQAAVAIDNAHLYAALEREAKALRESEELSSNVLNSTADCITVLDLQGDLLSINPPGLKLFEIEAFEPLQGKSWADLWPEEMRSIMRQAIAEAVAGNTGRFQGACPTAKGTVKWWDVIITPLRDAEGRVARLTATSRDITEQRKATERAEAAVAEAHRQSRMKDEFLATLSHELRTPLQSILGWTQVLQSEGYEDGELRQGLEVIARNAQSQTRIIEDLLDMSRILSGKVRLDVQHVELGSVIEAAVESIKPAAQSRGIRLQVIIDPHAPLVSGDPNRLQQVFWNLLSNAIKFTPRDGRVQVLLERVNSHLEVSVKDTGVGISPEFLPYVFERFRQADASTTRSHGGLGLGLAIVKHLVELHGGSVRVKSPGLSQGSTFSVVLPLAILHSAPEDHHRHPAVPAAASVGAELPRLDNFSVVVVDDEEDARNLIAKMLAKAGAIVRTASSAEEAMRLVLSEAPDVLISDIGMPQQDGFALIRSIRALPKSKGGQIPAIALTAYTRTEDRVRVIAEGFHMHLAKPADGLELLTMVESLAKMKKAVDAR